MNEVLKYALQYHYMGLSVIPIPRGQKWPSIEWRRLQTERVTLAEVYKWFQDPDQSIGIVTGAISGISVVDVDTQDPVPCLMEAPSPIIVTTKRGRHIYYRYSNLANTTAGVKDHVDIRSDGGLVVVPPSIGYSWNKFPFSLSELPDFPTSLLSDSRGNGEGELSRAKLDVAEVLTSLQEGNRNASFTRVVGRLHFNSWSPADIRSLLEPHAVRCDFSLGELDTIIRSVTRYQDQRPVEVDEVENLDSFLENVQDVKWICEPIIAERTIGFCAGLPESSKTWILMDLAIEAARGGMWLGKFPVKQTKTLFVDQERFRGETQRRFRKLKAAKSLGTLPNLYVRTSTSTRLNLDDSFASFRRTMDKIRPGLLIIDSFATFHTSDENSRQNIQAVLERVKQLREEFNCCILFVDHETKGILNPEIKAQVPNAFTMVGSVGKPAAAEFVLTVRKDKDNLVNVYHTKSSLGPSIEPLSVSVTDMGEGTVVKSIN